MLDIRVICIKQRQPQHHSQPRCDEANGRKGGDLMQAGKWRKIKRQVTDNCCGRAKRYAAHYAFQTLLGCAWLWGKDFAAILQAVINRNTDQADTE